MERPIRGLQSALGKGLVEGLGGGGGHGAASLDLVVTHWLPGRSM